MMKSSVSQRASFRLICVGLALLSLAVYSRLLTCDFIDFDDPDYVTENQHVLDGLTLNGFAWAFRSTCGQLAPADLDFAHGRLPGVWAEPGGPSLQQPAAAHGQHAFVIWRPAPA